MCWCVSNRARIDVVEVKRTAEPVRIRLTGRHQSQSGYVGKWVGIEFSVDMVVIGRAAAMWMLVNRWHQRQSGCVGKWAVLNSI